VEVFIEVGNVSPEIYFIPIIVRTSLLRAHQIEEINLYQLISLSRSIARRYS